MTEAIIHISEGNITERQSIWSLFSGLQDGIYQVIIKLRRKRTIPQNKYYWGIVCDMVKIGLQDIGYRHEVRDAEDAHEVMKSLFLKQRKVFNEHTGDVLTEISGRTSVLSTVEFEDYLDQIRQWASEYLGIYIPLPNEWSVEPDK